MNIVRLELESVLRHPLADEEIVARVVAGDLALFEVLMRRHNQRLYRAALAILRDRDEAEDVVQQAYINAYAHLEQFGGRSSVATWLTRIAVYEAYARLRKRSPVDDLDERDGEISDPASISPEREVLNSELRETLEAEIGALPEKYRVVFMLREVEGLDTSTTAELLGVSEDVVKTRLSRARERLRSGLFDRAGLTRSNLFTFLGARCDLLVANVFEAIEASRQAG
ncbi:MAG: RNA polymerase sigma factor [Thermoanaerobaculia bacterium]|nr:RNA polymerase sigma factor [Thermoanaerobaculia bacterium]